MEQLEEILGQGDDESIEKLIMKIRLLKNGMNGNDQQLITSFFDE